MTVYRVEHWESGRGPYSQCLGWVLNDICASHAGPAHPSTSEDGLSTCKPCGFLSLETLRRWFKGWMRKLRAAGFVIIKLEVPPDAVFVGKSGKQVVFEASKAKLVEVME